MTNLEQKPSVVNEDENRDLGFGARVAGESRKRLLNRDGSFNVSRAGLNPLAAFSLYQSLLRISWPKFFLVVTIGYFVVNTVFALAYLLCGPGALQAPENLHIGNRFWVAFFFSVDTMATIGYGNISPVGVAANLIVTVEALFGLLGVALVTGILFARFSRPTAQILFSRNALIAPYDGVPSFLFRIANERLNQIAEAHLSVTLVRNEFTAEGDLYRTFNEMKLERSHSPVFALTWTVVHPIDAESPLFGKTAEDLEALQTEFMVFAKAWDETFSQTVHQRFSYRYSEVVWGARFTPAFGVDNDGDLQLHVDKVGNYSTATVPTLPPSPQG